MTIVVLTQDCPCVDVNQRTVYGKKGQKIDIKPSYLDLIPGKYEEVKSDEALAEEEAPEEEIPEAAAPVEEIEEPKEEVSEEENLFEVEEPLEGSTGAPEAAAPAKKQNKNK